MAKICKCCGSDQFEISRNWSKSVPVELFENSPFLRVDKAVIELTPSEMKLFRRLFRDMPNFVTITQIMDRLYPIHQLKQGQEGTARVIASRVRHKLAGTRLRLNGYPGYGYQLVLGRVK